MFTESLLYHSIIPTRKSMKSNLCMYTRKRAMLHRIIKIFGHMRWTLQGTGKPILTLNRHLCIICCIKLYVLLFVNAY